MNILLQNDTAGIDWQSVTDILQEVGMNCRNPETNQKAFENSFALLFVFDKDLLIAFGRAISDGTCQAALYDVAVRSAYQGSCIGKMIVSQLMAQCPPGCNFILYATPGKEPFYEKLGFRKMKTGMAMFSNPERMQERGFTD